MICYKGMTFCSAKDCRNLQCDRNTNRPDFQPNDLPVAYAGFRDNCKEYEKEQKDEDLQRM